MSKSLVGVFFEPRLYADIFKRLLKSLDFVEVLEPVAKSPDDFLREWCEKVDVIIFSLDSDGQPKVSLLPVSFPNAKYIAFSPDGRYGFRRLPGESDWEELKPFGIEQMVSEINWANGG